jgi:FKBP-type peptidyl-prolyl cis-trans isomerase 2
MFQKSIQRLECKLILKMTKDLKRKFRVTNIDKDKITFDGNHPFSGKTLIYKIKIIDVANTEVVKD